jgi:hypothetical protein
MTGLFIAARRVEHDGSRKVIAAGSLIGEHACIKLAPGYGFIKGAEMLCDTLVAARQEAAAKEAAP